MVDVFIEEIGTVRSCKDCGALIAGGPVRCIRCAKEGPPKQLWTNKIEAHRSLFVVAEVKRFVSLAEVDPTRSGVDAG